MFFQLKLKSIKLKWPQQRSLCYLAVFEGFRQRNAECIYFSELKWSAHSVCCLFLLLAIRIITICLFFAWTGISGRSSPMCLFTVAKQSIIIIIKHPGNLPPQPQDAHMHRPTQRQYHRIHTHTIAIIAPLLVSHSHFLQPSAKSRAHLWKWPLKARDCYKQDPPVPLGWVAQGSRQALCCQHGE